MNLKSYSMKRMTKLLSLLLLVPIVLDVMGSMQIPFFKLMRPSAFSFITSFHYLPAGLFVIVANLGTKVQSLIFRNYSRSEVFIKFILISHAFISVTYTFFLIRSSNFIIEWDSVLENLLLTLFYIFLYFNYTEHSMRIALNVTAVLFTCMQLFLQIQFLVQFKTINIPTLVPFLVILVYMVYVKQFGNLMLALHFEVYPNKLIRDYLPENLKNEDACALGVIGDSDCRYVLLLCGEGENSTRILYDVKNPELSREMEFPSQENDQDT